MEKKKIEKDIYLHLYSKDEKIDERFKDVVYVVEATSFEYGTYWKENRDLKENDADYYLEWEEDRSGLSLVIGSMLDKPICLSVRFAKLNGLIVLFFEPTSQVINWQLIDLWFDEYCYPLIDERHNYSDSSNFHNCKNFIIHKTEKFMWRKKVIKDLLKP